MSILRISPNGEDGAEQRIGRRSTKMSWPWPGGREAASRTPISWKGAKWRRVARMTAEGGKDVDFQESIGSTEGRRVASVAPTNEDGATHSCLLGVGLV